MANAAENQRPPATRLAPVTPIRAATKKMLLTPASKVKPKVARWLWSTAAEGEHPVEGGRIPYGALTLWAGGPGIGKSQAAIWIVAQVTRGTLPGALHGEPAKVVYLSTEDDWAMTIAPRLMAAGADLENVFHVAVFEEDAAASSRKKVQISLPEDTSLLVREAAEAGVKLIVCDPLISFVGKINADKQPEVRAALEPFTEAAAAHGISVIGLAHFIKNTAATKDPLSAIYGSGAFAQLARAAVVFAKERDDDGQVSYVMSQAKNNLGRDDLSSYVYTIETVTLEIEEETVPVPRFTIGEETDRGVHEVMADSAADGKRGPKPVARGEAEEWLRAFLDARGGSANAPEVQEAAEEAGHSWRTMQRAANTLGVEKSREKRKGGQGVWTLPPCGRCDGSGWREEYLSANGGECYECNQDRHKPRKSGGVR